MSYIKTAHPKKSVSLKLLKLDTYLNNSWIAQAKKNGTKAQIHVLSNGRIKVYGRQGQILTGSLSTEIRNIILEAFSAGDVFEAEWLKIKQALYIFDMVAKEGLILHSSSYKNRYKLLPQIKTEAVETLPILISIQSIHAAHDDPENEGVVFKSMYTPGFRDESIVRCRRPDMKDMSVANKRRDR